MALETITIPLDSETAKAYKSEPASDQRKMQALVGLWLKDLAAVDSSTLEEIMNNLSKKAHSRGLTPERLGTLLASD